MNRESEWITTSTVLKRLADFDDRDAWSRFAERFREPIERFARRQGLSEADSEDVAQETLLGFAQAYRDKGYDRTKGRLSQWLFGIAWRRVDHVRRKRDRPDAERTAGDGATAFWDGVAGDPAASASWDAAWEEALLERCVRQVRGEVQPATFRAFEMIVLEKRSMDDTVAELALTRNAVYVAKHRVTKRMRELLAELEEVV